MWAMSDRALPRSLRMMEGFGVHTFRFVNAAGDSRFVKFHWRPRLGMLISFVIAYYLDRVRFGQGLLRALYFVPHLTTAVAMAWVWRWFYQPPPVGAFNVWLTSLGFAQMPFLRSTTQALPAVLAPAIWAGIGFQIVIFLAGLKAIPRTYYEAAEIDGAGAWRVLFEVTLPLLRPTIVFLVVTSSIAYLRIFDYVYAMGLSRDLRTKMAGGDLDAVVVRLAPRERAKAIWSEAQVWVAREDFELARGDAVPLALLPAPCVLREHALESMKRLRRPWKVSFTGSSMVSVQAAVSAGLGVSIIPRSSLLPGMKVLSRSRDYPHPGRLDVGVLPGAGARKDIVDALEQVMRQTLDVLAVSRMAA